MKKIILLLLIFCFHLNAYNQVISGTVLDKKTKEKVSFAAIYFNGTFVGTTSDIDGNFRLNVSKNASMPLTISCMGYYSVTLSDYLVDNPLTIYMEPMAFEVNEVVVSGKSLVRKRKANLKLFKSQFLGTTENGLNCEILNEEDITFNYDSDRDTLKAFASKPLRIYNRNLGYKITFYLDNFMFDRKNRIFNYKGNIIFNEDLSTENTNKNLYQTRRINTYQGSRMHFFRALWNNELKLSGFEIRNLENEVINYDDFVFQEVGELMDSIITYKKYIRYPANLKINYNHTLSPVILKSRVYFDETGHFDFSGINWQGEMAIKRIGDSLPYEYDPKASSILR